jgi:transcription initiation factor TFIID subunit 12
LFQANQIRQLTILSEEEKTKYISGVEGLWAKIRSSPAHSPDYKQATEKLVQFSRMLHTKLQQRQAQLQQHRQAQMQHHKAQLQQQQKQAQQQPQQQPPQQQQQQQGQQQPPQSQGQQQGQQIPQPKQGQTPQPKQSQPPRPPSANQQSLAKASPQTQGQGQQQAGGNAGAGASAPASGTVQPQQAGQPNQVRLPDRVVQRLRGVPFKLPPHIKDKAKQEEYLNELRAKYGRAMVTIESAKNKIAAIDRSVNAKKEQGNPFSDAELRSINENRAAQLKTLGEATRWLDAFCKQHVEQRAGQNGQPPAQASPGNAQNGGQANNPAMAANQQQQQQAAVAGNRPSPANGATANAQTQNRNAPNTAQHAQAQLQAQKAEQAPPTPANNAPAGQVQQTAAQGAARVQTPGASTPVTTAGPSHALSHAAAMSLANQRAANTAGTAQAQGQQQQPVGTPTSAGMVAQNSGGQAGQQQSQHQQQPIPQQHQPQAQQAQQHQQTVHQVQAQSHQQHAHPHAHPTQPQSAIHTKMPIPKQLPEKATAVPQGVTLGGGVKGNRPTLNQGTGTMGSALHQPAVAKIPAYNNEAEGDHVLSKKKLDELVRQVCGGSSEGQEGNLLTPEVEEVRSLLVT